MTILVFLFFKGIVIISCIYEEKQSISLSRFVELDASSLHGARCRLLQASIVVFVNSDVVVPCLRQCHWPSSKPGHPRGYRDLEDTSRPPWNSRSTDAINRSCKDNSHRAKTLQYPLDFPDRTSLPQPQYPTCHTIPKALTLPFHLHKAVACIHSGSQALVSTSHQIPS